MAMPAASDAALVNNYKRGVPNQLRPMLAPVALRVFWWGKPRLSNNIAPGP